MNYPAITSLLTVGLLTAGAAQAEIPNPDVYLGLSGGGNLVLSGWDLNETEDGDPVDGESSGLLKLRVGLQLNQMFAVEAGAGWLPVTAGGDDNNVFIYDVDLLVHLLEGNWVPFVDVGAGTYHNPDGDSGPDGDPQLHYGLGLRGMVADHVTIRAEARHVLSDGVEQGLSNNIELTAGLDVFFGGRTPPPPPDSDGDGVLDAEDACPDVAGVASAAGCPDGDRDGVADGDDRCPDAAGSAALAGCSDRDGDGLVDGDDACPEEAGAADQKGCPIRDRDRDGVLDGEDRCPETAGDQALGGCPDKDGDRIADGDDRCPEVAGVPEHSGCQPPPKEVVAQFSGRFEGILFDSGTAALTEASKPKLDGAAETLAKFPGVRLRVEGHTDSSGDAEKNKALSTARAEAVRDYLVSKGITADRLETTGLGSDTPIESNKTRQGRARNRRIEFHIISR